MIPIETGGLLLRSRDGASLSSQLCSLPFQHTLLRNRREFFVIALMKRLIISWFLVDNRLSFGKIYQLLRYPLPSKLLRSRYITFNFTDRSLFLKWSFAFTGRQLDEEQWQVAIPREQGFGKQGFLFILGPVFSWSLLLFHRWWRTSRSSTTPWQSTTSRLDQRSKVTNQCCWSGFSIWYVSDNHNTSLWL